MSVTLTVTQVRVRYEGRRTSWDPDARYSYLVATNDIEAKVLSSDESEYVGGRAEMRQVRDLHGLQLLFSQEAELYVFDLPTLFLTLLSGLALLSMAKVSPSPSRSSSPSPRPLRLVRPHPSPSPSPHQVAADSFLLYLAPRRLDYRLFVSCAPTLTVMLTLTQTPTLILILTLTPRRLD